METEDIYERFHKLEKACIGFDNYVDCEEKNFIKALDDLRLLVNDI